MRINQKLPDAGRGMCCIGAAVYGPGGCTCWETTCDKPQEEPCAGPLNVRSTMCGDCAFRPDSPERNGDSRYQHSTNQERFDLLTNPKASFACHQGMRKVTGKQFTPENEVPKPRTRTFIPEKLNTYRPHQDGHHTSKADGTPAALCAGWFANKARGAS